MTKEEVLALVSDKKAAAGSVFDEIATAVESIEVVGGDQAELVAELQQQLADKSAELEALKEVEASEHVDLDSVKADLESAKAKLEKDEVALAKFKAILAELSV